MRTLIDDLARLVHGRGGNAAHDAARMSDLTKIVQDLTAIGYHLHRASDLQELHLRQLVHHWRTTGESGRRITQLLHALHWWADKLGRGHLFQFREVTKGLYQIPQQFINPAWSLSPATKLPEPRMQGALMLMEAFGLRLNEAILLPLPRALPFHRELTVAAGLPAAQSARTVPILNHTQRNLLRALGEATDFTRLLPRRTQTLDFANDMMREAKAAAFLPLSGLRMSYAQWRYSILMPFACPLAGGPATAFLPPLQREQDRTARATIGAELGLQPLESMRDYLG